MKKIILGASLLAFTVLSLPASAQGVYLGFGDGPRYDRSYYGSGYRSYDGYQQRPRYSYNSYASDYRHCRVKRVWVGDHYRRVRRCW
jgi:hypothetical protein